MSDEKPKSFSAGGALAGRRYGQLLVIVIVFAVVSVVAGAWHTPAKDVLIVFGVAIAIGVVGTLLPIREGLLVGLFGVVCILVGVLFGYFWGKSAVILWLCCYMIMVGFVLTLRGKSKPSSRQLQADQEHGTVPGGGDPLAVSSQWSGGEMTANFDVHQVQFRSGKLSAPRWRVELSLGTVQRWFHFDDLIAVNNGGVATSWMQPWETDRILFARVSVAQPGSPVFKQLEDLPHDSVALFPTQPARPPFGAIDDAAYASLYQWLLALREHGTGGDHDAL